jgi:hypothetical protein
LVLFAILITACNQQNPETFQAQLPEGAYPVDPLFSSFYSNLGGQETLGISISPMFAVGDRRFQYVENGCLEYDPSQPSSQAFRLSSLGLDMQVSDPKVSPSGRPGSIYVDGFNINPEVLPLYQQLGGARFTGRPLTEMHHNPDQKRYEQYFENVGFYWSEAETPDKIALLAYGAWKCDVKCRKPLNANSIVKLSPSVGAGMISPFREAISRLGPDFTGFSESNVYYASDGNIEQIFQYLVLFADPDNLSRVHARPLTEMLGMLPDPLEMPSELRGMYFFPTEGSLGYNIPYAFFNYIIEHGGFEISGPPVTRVFMTEENHFQQCFKNICIEYHLNANLPEDRRIRPVPLGTKYRQSMEKTPQVTFEDTQSYQSISMFSWERYPIVKPDQNQEIAVGLFENGVPLLNIEPILYLTLPDGSQQALYFPPTGPNGFSYLRLDPIKAQNATLIPYEVCISSVLGESMCKKESFLIWHIP